MLSKRNMRVTPKTVRQPRCHLRDAVVLGVLVAVAFTASARLAVGSQYTPVTTDRLLSPDPHNWPMYRRTYNGWGYSPLDQIARTNVASLVPVWTFSTDSSRDHQSPPIVNDGRMFVTTPLDEGGHDPEAELRPGIA